MKEREVYAAIAMALYELSNETHDIENTVLTIRQTQQPSSWNSKILEMRQQPDRKF